MYLGDKFMKQITISTENCETYSSISNFFIDYYMTEANGEFVKVYLYLVRLLSSNAPITISSIADHFNLTENDICRAIKYWIKQDALKLCYDGSGSLTGIVFLPLKAPTSASLSGKALDILTAPSAAPTNNVINIDDHREETREEGPFVPKRTEASKADIERCNKDTAFTDSVFAISAIFGKPAAQTNLDILIYIYDELGFSPELMEYLAEYCGNLKKTNYSYMEAVAISWYKDNVTTVDEAKKHVGDLDKVTKICFKALGITGRVPTENERKFMDKWSKEYKFTNSMIQLACERGIDKRPNSVNFKYIDGIIEDWHKKGLKTASDVKKDDENFQAAKLASKTSASTAKVHTINNFPQTDMGSKIDEIEKMMLQRANRS